MVEYPRGPPPAGKEILPGEGININPLDQNDHLDYTTPLGGCTGIYYGLIFQLSKWGYESAKIDESMFVSPANKAYYNITLEEKNNLANQIKAGLASIAQAYSDLELILHDLRKYKQYLEYFEKIVEAEKKIKEAKTNEEKEKWEKERQIYEQTLRSIFIDQVDVHTDLPNTPIALRSIVSRWPTIISDFMKLKNETKPEDIKLDVSYAEKVVLATKNKLFLQWKEMFEENVKERYRRLRELVEARRKSVKEYKEMLRPIIARYKMIVDALSSEKLRSSFLSAPFSPGAQAWSMDSMTIWAWKAYAVEEKWKATREIFDKVPLEKAGFTKEEIEELKKDEEIKREIKDGLIDALPIEPSIDRIVREIVKRIESEYNVKITARDLFDARKKLLDRYKGGGLEGAAGVTWPFSPYFLFAEIPLIRWVLVLPNGVQIEDLEVKNLATYIKTQNVMIGHLLEIRAREKKFEEEISALMGEFGVDKEGKYKKIEELLKEEFPGIYGEPVKKEEKKEEKKIDFFEPIKKILKYFGLDVMFFRAKGPYEFSIEYRIAKYYLKISKLLFWQIRDFLNESLNVPGAKVEVKV
jgi:hypothetical protein